MTRLINLVVNFDYKYFARLIDWLANNKITTYSVHAGSYKTGTNKIDAYTKFLKSVRQLKKLCRDRNITLGVETMYATPPESSSQNLLDKAAEIKQFCQDAAEIKLVMVKEIFIHQLLKKLSSYPGLICFPYQFL